jgi:hypothetical protein
MTSRQRITNILFLISLAVPTVSNALENCTRRLYEETCGPGHEDSADDGTGMLNRKDSAKRLKKIYDKSYGDFKNEFKKIVLARPDLKDIVDKKITPVSGRCLYIFDGLCNPTFDQKLDFAAKYLAFGLNDFNPNAKPSDPEPFSSNIPGEASYSDGTMTLGLEAKYHLTTDPSISDLIVKNKQAIQDVIAAAQKYQGDYIKNYLVPQIKASIKKVIDRLPPGPQKEKMKTKIDSITPFTGFCIDGIQNPQALYSRKTNQLMYCMATMFKSSSLFVEVQHIAHEMGHAVSPCNMQDGDSAWAPLITCLRTPASINARTKNGASGTKCDFANEDQTDEAFADWMGSEVLADLSGTLTLAMKNLSPQKFTNGLTNIYKPFCNGLQNKQQTAHPRDRDRLELITANPKIQARMGCRPTPVKTYCDVSGAISTGETPNDLDLPEVER